MAKAYSLGPCTLEFKPRTGSGVETIIITETFEDDDTKLTSTVSPFEIKIDQALGPVLSKVANVEASLACSIPFDPEVASKLCAEWEKGATGFALGNIGAVSEVFELTIKPKGSTEPADWLVAPHVTVKADTSVDFKKEGLSKFAITVMFASDERAAEKTFGKVLTTGDYTKVSA